MTCLFDQTVLLLGEIGCGSLLGLKGLIRLEKLKQTWKQPLPPMSPPPMFPPPPPACDNGKQFN